MKLTPRLKTIADLVPQNAIVADIGTDHGYIPVYLLENGISPKIIATDVNEGPIENAKKTINQYSFESYIETRLGNGLEPLNINEIDTIIIAGMGGMLIKEILNNRSELVRSLKNIILQPMNAQDQLRKWLHHNGYEIIKEKLVREDNKIYEVILAKVGTMEIKDEIFYEIGYKLPEEKDNLFKVFVDRKIKKYTKILNMVNNEESKKAVVKRHEIEAKLKKLQEVKRCL